MHIERPAEDPLSLLTNLNKNCIFSAVDSNLSAAAKAALVSIHCLLLTRHQKRFSTSCVLVLISVLKLKGFLLQLV